MANRSLTRSRACGTTLSRPTGEGYDELLTQEELAARLKVGLRTLVRMQHEGKVPSIVLGKSVRFYWPAGVSHLTANSTVTKQK
jgi:excisionase family DNA binding protein